MKSIFILAISLSIATSAFGAIEFSEDQVITSGTEISAVESTGSATEPSVGVEPSGQVPVSSAAQAASVAATSSQSTGIAGTPAVVTAASMMGGGGGQTDEGEEDGQSEEPGVTATAEPGDEGGESTEDAVATPEPSALIVWVVLACCGLAFVRLRRS